MRSSDADVLVIGAGVSGLTTAVCLAEAGARVAVQAELPPGWTTSAVAGAIWGPHLVGPADRVDRWGLATLERLYELAGPDQPGTGIRLLGGRQVAGPDGFTEDLIGPLADVRPCGSGDLPEGYASGWRYTAPVISMPVYLDYLVDRLTKAGGTLETGITFGSPAEAAGRTAAKVLVNCTGTGAHGFARDPDVVPVRGQAVVVRNPGLSEFFIGIGRDGSAAGHGLVYLFPHESTVVLGGTAGHRQLEPGTGPGHRGPHHRRLRRRRACAARRRGDRAQGGPAPDPPPGPAGGRGPGGRPHAGAQLRARRGGRHAVLGLRRGRRRPRPRRPGLNRR